MLHTNRPSFEIGLTLAGAVSAGAYTAGVIDFLIEALDAWSERKHGPDVLHHDVELKVSRSQELPMVSQASLLPS